MNCPVDYVDLCAKDVENIAGVSKPDYSPIPPLFMKPLENKVFLVASPQECIGGVPKQ